MDNISSTLGTRQVYDDIAGEYAPAEPQFFMKVGTAYMELPKNSETLIALGKYLMQVGEAIEGVVFRKHTEYTSADVQNAKEKLERFRKGSA